jgi:hypothetical protein
LDLVLVWGTRTRHSWPIASFCNNLFSSSVLPWLSHQSEEDSRIKLTSEKEVKVKEPGDASRPQAMRLSHSGFPRPSDVELLLSYLLSRSAVCFDCYCICSLDSQQHVMLDILCEIYRPLMYTECGTTAQLRARRPLATLTRASWTC